MTILILMYVANDEWLRLNGAVPLVPTGDSQSTGNNNVIPEQLDGGRHFDDIGGIRRRYNRQRRYKYISRVNGSPLPRGRLHSFVESILGLTQPTPIPNSRIMYYYDTTSQISFECDACITSISAAIPARCQHPKHQSLLATADIRLNRNWRVFYCWHHLDLILHSAFYTDVPGPTTQSIIRKYVCNSLILLVIAAFAPASFAQYSVWYQCL